MSEDRLLPVAPGDVVARRLWVMLRERPWRLVLILLLFALEAATAVVFPLVVGSLVDTVLDHSAGVPTVFWWQVGLLVAAAVGAGFFAWAGAVALARLAETIIADMREAYVAAALDLPRAVIEKAGTGDVVTRASEDIAQVSDALPNVLPRVAVSTFTLALVFAGLGTLDPRYLVGFVLTIPMYALSAWWYLRTAPAVYRSELSTQSERGQHILGTLTQLPTVTAHRLEGRQLERISGAAWESVRWAMRTRIVQNRLFGRLNLTEAVGLLGVLCVGIWLAFDGSATTGEVTAAALLFLRTVAPIDALLFVMDDLQSGLAALGRLMGVIDLVPDDEPASDTASSAHQVDDTEPIVSLASVDFSYDGRMPVLQQVDLHIGATETLAVVGATGSGKSTLASLVSGVHEPSSGSLIRRVAPEQIVSVSQETHVFATSLRENLALATPNATDEELTEALQRAGASHLLLSLPAALDTPVGHGGHSLSPAAAQHLALARVCLVDPALVILDEATAEADTADTAVLEAAAVAATRDSAALVIAHRLSQAASADRIIVIERGRVVESGTHDELAVSDGLYARLWQAWQSGRGTS